MSTDTPAVGVQALGTLRYCGREFSPAELARITALAAALPTRAAIAEAVCVELGWRRPDGRTKAMSARVALNRMAADGLIDLPAPRNSNGNGALLRYALAEEDGLAPASVTTDLGGLGPLTYRLVATGADSRIYNACLAAHHYLGYTPLAGAQLRYLVEATVGVVAVLGFGASAWSCASRDAHIGWDITTRKARLHLVAGNARFLILPHISVPNLASHVLGHIARRLPPDWQTAYGYAPVLLETFVETGRFTGASYRAANWIRVGATQGRGKLDVTHARALPIKDVYLYPLRRDYRAILTAAS